MSIHPPNVEEYSFQVWRQFTHALSNTTHLSLARDNHICYNPHTTKLHAHVPYRRLPYRWPRRIQRTHASTPRPISRPGLSSHAIADNRPPRIPQVADLVRSAPTAGRPIPGWPLKSELPQYLIQESLEGHIAMSWHQPSSIQTQRQPGHMPPELRETLLLDDMNQPK